MLSSNEYTICIKEVRTYNHKVKIMLPENYDIGEACKDIKKYLNESEYGLCSIYDVTGVDVIDISDDMNPARRCDVVEPDKETHVNAGSYIS